MDNKNFFVCGVAGKGFASKAIGDQYVIGVIEDKNYLVHGIAEHIGAENVEMLESGKVRANGVHLHYSTKWEKFVIGEEELGYSLIDEQSGIITNEFHRDKGTPKHVLFKSWIKELGMDKALLLNHNYPVTKVVAMSEEEAESETQALGYGI